MLILPPKFFDGTDGGEAALNEIMRELYENPNTPSADMYLLQQPVHLPAKYITPDFRDKLRSAGAISASNGDGIILLPNRCPPIIKKAEDDGWIKTKFIPRHYQVDEGAFVHIPKGPRIPQKTKNPDPVTARRELRCVTDKEQQIVDSNPEYLKLEITVTEKSKRKYQLQELKREIGNMGKINIGNLTNYGNATFGDNSPIISPNTLKDIQSAIEEKEPDNNFTKEMKNTIVDELKLFSKGKVKSLTKTTLNKLVELSPLLGDKAMEAIRMLSERIGF
jgi:hypothetical protein